MPKIKCPRKYAAYDVMTKDCPECEEGVLYQRCKHCSKFACDGWMDEKGTSCCKCYQERHEKDGQESGDGN